jgi:hypothetical protein
MPTSETFDLSVALAGRTFPSGETKNPRGGSPKTAFLISYGYAQKVATDSSLLMPFNVLNRAASISNNSFLLASLN